MGERDTDGRTWDDENVALFMAWAAGRLSDERLAALFGIAVEEIKPVLVEMVERGAWLGAGPSESEADPASTGPTERGDVERYTDDDGEINFRIKEAPGSAKRKRRT